MGVQGVRSCRVMRVCISMYESMSVSACVVCVCVCVSVCLSLCMSFVCGCVCVSAKTTITALNSSTTSPFEGVRARAKESVCV